MLIISCRLTSSENFQHKDFKTLFRIYPTFITCLNVVWGVRLGVHKGNKAKQSRSVKKCLQPTLHLCDHTFIA